MKFRESFNNAIRSDRPESVTDMIFLYLGIIAGGLWVLSNIIQKDIVALSVMVTFLSTLKVIKIGSDFQKKRKANCIESCDNEAQPKGATNADTPATS